jgi:multidrug efflux pump subunit AcrB
VAIHYRFYPRHHHRFFAYAFYDWIFGKIITAIPIGVILALLMSLLVSFFILPAQYARFVPNEPDRKSGDAAEGKNSWSRLVSRISNYWDDVVAENYRKVLVRVVTRRYLVMTSVLIVTFLMLGFLFVKSKKVLFPPDGIEAFYIDTVAPAGMPLSEHAEHMKPLEALVKKLPENELLNYNTTIGSQTEGPGDPESRRGDQYGRIKIFLTPESQRDRIAADIIDDLRSQVGKPAHFKQITFGRVRAGPPVGKPISVGIRGADFDRINLMADRVKNFLQQIPGASDIQDSFNPGKEELQIRLKEAEVIAAGLTSRQVARAILAAFEGLEATNIRKLDEEIEVRVQYPAVDRQKLDSLSKLLISGPNGYLIPLEKIASWKPQASLASIEHEGFKRQVKITGDIDTNVTDADRVADAVRAKVPEWTKDFPDITFNFGGEDQDTKESFEALGRAFLVAIIGIFMILVLTFGTFIQPFLILITIPFGALSALLAFYVHGFPISFFGMLGIISLGGVIVNNAIVLIDFVNQEREAGLDRFQSIYEAGSRRLRAIFLSTITNIVGVIPTAYGFGGEDKFVIPIAIALGWGLALGAVLTAVFFPAFLAVSDDLSDFFSRKKKRA